MPDKAGSKDFPAISEETWEEFEVGKVMFYVTNVYTYAELCDYMILNGHKFRLLMPLNDGKPTWSKFEAIVVSSSITRKANGRIVEIQ